MQTDQQNKGPCTTINKLNAALKQHHGVDACVTNVLNNNDTVSGIMRY